MKIVFLSRYQDSISRGAETFVLELSRELSKKHEVSILSGDKADSMDEILKGNYQIVVAVNGGVQSLKASLGRFRKNYKQSLKFSLRSNYKLVISGQAGIGRGEIFNIVIAKPDLFVALTDKMFDFAKGWAWGSRVVKIPNGVDLNKFKPVGEKMDLKLKKPVILSVGALVWYKYHERTIRALSLLEQGTLVIVGEGPQKSKLQDLGNRLLSNRFKIIQAEYKDLPAIYRGADLFVLPSWEREAFGIVYLEALASGLGVVAPNDLSRNEIIGKAGILVEVSDPKKYAQAINQALKMDWKEKAIKQAEKFSWEKIAREYERAFENLL